MRDSRSSAAAVETPARCSIRISRCWAWILPAHARDFVADPVELHSALSSSGTSPNFRISLASPNSPVAGSPLRLKATAPTWPGFRDSASARITAALALNFPSPGKPTILNSPSLREYGAPQPRRNPARASRPRGRRFETASLKAWPFASNRRTTRQREPARPTGSAERM